MAYVAPVHRATSIRHALRTRFTSPDHDDLVLAKANRLEIWRVTDGNMVCQHTKVIYGTVPQEPDLKISAEASALLETSLLCRSHIAKPAILRDYQDDPITDVALADVSRNASILPLLDRGLSGLMSKEIYSSSAGQLHRSQSFGPSKEAGHIKPFDEAKSLMPKSNDATATSKLLAGFMELRRAKRQKS